MLALDHLSFKVFKCALLPHTCWPSFKPSVLPGTAFPYPFPFSYPFWPPNYLPDNYELLFIFEESERVSPSLDHPIELTTFYSCPHNTLNPFLPFVPYFSRPIDSNLFTHLWPSFVSNIDLIISLSRSHSISYIYIYAHTQKINIIHVKYSL